MISSIRAQSCRSRRSAGSGRACAIRQSGKAWVPGSATAPGICEPSWRRAGPQASRSGERCSWGALGPSPRASRILFCFPGPRSTESGCRVNEAE